MPKGLYIHIPFCDHICTYCDFPKLLTKGQRHEAYVESLIRELRYYEQQVGFDEVQTVYIGGGTPTALSIEQIRPLFDYLAQVLPLDQLVEFSLEANPENLTEEKVNYFIANHVSRFSLGVQTFDEQLLKIIGRKHRRQEVHRAVSLLQSKGITNINIDLIYSIPTQTLEQVQRDVEEAISLGVEHISAYSLIVEEHTPLYLAYMKDQVTLTDNELEAHMYELVINTLEKNGYHHYEISNFSTSRPSIHNQWYWKNKTYFGVGLGAHGYIEGVRYQNTRSINAYIEKLNKGELPIIESRTLTVEEHLEEEMFLGLRLQEGVDLSEISAHYERDVESLYRTALQQLIKEGYLIRQNNRIKLTRRGLLMANDVFEQFLLSI